MLEEAVEVMRRLWTGEVVDHRGTYYTVDNAPDLHAAQAAAKVWVSGFGPRPPGSPGGWATAM